MCLAVIAFEAHADWPLIVLANRDEFHTRASRTLAPWPTQPDILGGIDLEAGGTWLALDNAGRLALLTNVRDPLKHKAKAPSRGELAARFITNEIAGEDFLNELSDTAHQYNGFNLLIAEPTNDGTRGASKLWHASNYQRPFVHSIDAGVHGLSNAVLNTPWPKTEQTKTKLSQFLPNMAEPDPDALIRIMLDTTSADEASLPATGVSRERERLLAPAFIVSPEYGTRCTTLVLRHRSGTCWVQEDSYGADGQLTVRVRWHHGRDGVWRRTEDNPSNLITD